MWSCHPGKFLICDCSSRSQEGCGRVDSVWGKGDGLGGFWGPISSPSIAIVKGTNSHFEYMQYISKESFNCLYSHAGGENMGPNNCRRKWALGLCLKPSSKAESYREVQFWKELGLGNQLFLTINKDIIPLSMLHQNALSFRWVSVIYQHVQVIQTKMSISLLFSKVI